MIERGGHLFLGHEHKAREAITAFVEELKGVPSIIG
jgi:hypothetical protein